MIQIFEVKDLADKTICGFIIDGFLEWNLYQCNYMSAEVMFVL